MANPEVVIKHILFQYYSGGNLCDVDRFLSDLEGSLVESYKAFRHDHLFQLLLVSTFKKEHLISAVQSTLPILPIAPSKAAGRLEL